MSAWRSIDSAPKDGTRFVGLIPTAYMRTGFKPDICHWEKGLKEPQFIFTGWSYLRQPKHWMPLPEDDA